MVESLGNTVRYILDSVKGINNDMADVRRRVVVLEQGQTSQEQINATNGQRLIDVENRSFPVNLGRANRLNADLLGIQNSDGTVNYVIDAAIGRNIIPSKPRRSSDTA